MNNLHRDEHKAKLDQHLAQKQKLESLRGPGSYYLAQKSEGKDIAF